MPPTGAWYSIWSTEREDYDSPELLLDCLLPTGIIVQLKGVRKDATLADIKTVRFDQLNALETDVMFGRSKQASCLSQSFASFGE